MTLQIKRHQRRRWTAQQRVVRGSSTQDFTAGTNTALQIQKKA